MTVIRRWRLYGVNKRGPGTTYYQGKIDAPEDVWVVREQDYNALAEQHREAVKAFEQIRDHLAELTAERLTVAQIAAAHRIAADAAEYLGGQ